MRKVWSVNMLGVVHAPNQLYKPLASEISQRARVIKHGSGRRDLVYISIHPMTQRGKVARRDIAAGLTVRRARRPS